MRGVFLSLILIFFSACSENSLDIQDNNKLILKDDSKSHMIAEKILSFENLSLRHMDVRRMAIESVSKQVLFYEKITTENDYELKENSLELLKRIFNIHRINTVYKSSSLIFVQLEEEESYINLIAQTSSMTELSFVYGFSNKEFFQVANSLNIKADTLKVKNRKIIERFKSDYQRQEFVLNPLVDSKPGWSQ